MKQVAPAFVKMAHQIVWCTVATVDSDGRPRSRILHPIWQWDGRELIGWIATGPTPTKRAHLKASRVRLVQLLDAVARHVRRRVSRGVGVRRRHAQEASGGMFKEGSGAGRLRPGDDSRVGWPDVAEFRGAVLEPWRLRVFPGTVLMGKGGDVLTWME